MALGINEPQRDFGYNLPTGQDFGYNLPTGQDFGAKQGGRDFGYNPIAPEAPPVGAMVNPLDPRETPSTVATATDRATRGDSVSRGVELKRQQEQDKLKRLAAPAPTVDKIDLDSRMRPKPASIFGGSILNKLGIGG